MWKLVASCSRSAAGRSARSSAWIWWRGVITSSTAMLSKSNKLSKMLRCFLGKNRPDSSTIERNSSGRSCRCS
ncbi:MAG: hypothetical protein ACK559_31770, partial [bacterium]